MKDIFLVLLIITLACPVNSFAAWMTKDFCDRQLDEGEIIMNEAAILTNERHVRVLRDETELQSGSLYVPGETLNVQISDSTGQFVLESRHAEFLGGGCKHKNRVVKNHASLKMPETGTANITIKAGWSMGHQQVHLTPTFLLMAPRRRKSNIPGKHSHDHGDHHRAIGGDAIADLSKKMGSLFSSGSKKHSKEMHDKSVKDKDRKLNEEKAKVKRHGAVDHDKEIHQGAKRKRKHSDGDHVNVHTDFETKAEADKEQEEVENSHKAKGKGKKTHWRHAAKIIEKKLRGTRVEGEDAANMVLIFFCVLGIALVFVLYSVFRANRFKIGKFFRKDTGFKE